jgi:hypothetical protein
MSPLTPTISPTTTTGSSAVRASDDATPNKQGTSIGIGVGVALLILAVLYCIYRRSLRNSAASVNDERIKWSGVGEERKSEASHPPQPPWATSRTTFSGLGLNQIYLSDSDKHKSKDVIPSASSASAPATAPVSLPTSRKGSTFGFVNPFRASTQVPAGGIQAVDLKA